MSRSSKHERIITGTRERVHTKGRPVQPGSRGNLFGRLDEWIHNVIEPRRACEKVTVTHSGAPENRLTEMEFVLLHNAPARHDNYTAAAIVVR